MYNYIQPYQYDLKNERRIRTTNANERQESPAHNREQLHTHEYVGGTEIASPTDNSLFHNHRLAGVTGEAIPLPDGNHIHSLHGPTDFTKGHFHTINEKTGPAIQVGNGNHVHYAKSESSYDADHLHALKFATLIDDPTGE